MDSFHLGGVFKVEKPKKNIQNNSFHLRKLSNLFRIIELFVVLVLVSRFTFQLPVAVKSSGEYFRDLTFTLSSPSFVFILGNTIVITLFATSGHFSNRKVDFYDEFLQKSERIVNPNPSHVDEVVKCEEKKVIFEGKAAYQRSQSEKMISHVSSRVNRLDKELHRSKTEDFRKLSQVRGSKMMSIEGPFPEDNMSNDEFRRTIEAFIARQQRFLKEEEYVIM